MKPTIGVLAAVSDEKESSVQNPYIKAVEQCGGIPVLLPYVEQDGTLDRYARLCDGFFFAGGFDIAPQRYGEEPKKNCGALQRYRDEMDFKMFEKAFSTAKPILGICRGAQLINVALGGTLHQDIPSEIKTDIMHRQTEPTFSYSHAVRILENTPLHSLILQDHMKANSFHHQAIKRLGEGLVPMAVADDGILEAAYLPGKRYLRAYQWHPERLFEMCEYNKRIFVDFISACSMT